MLAWFFSLIGVCREHLCRTEWDGAKQDYVCPQCEREVYLKHLALEALEVVAGTPAEVAAFLTKHGLKSVKDAIRARIR